MKHFYQISIDFFEKKNLIEIQKRKIFLFCDPQIYGMYIIKLPISIHHSFPIKFLLYIYVNFITKIQLKKTIY